MPTPFVFNNRFRGQNKADYEDAYFDYMNNSNAVENYPLTTKRDYIKGVREARNAEYNHLNPLSTNLPDYSGMFNANEQRLIGGPVYGPDLSFLNEPEINGPFLENYVRPVQPREEQEVEDAEEAEAMEYGRRNLIKQQFTPIENPNYTQQAILPTQSPADILNQNRDSILAQKAAENKDLQKQIRKENRQLRRENRKEWMNKNASAISGITSLGSGLIDSQLDASYKGNQGAFVSGAWSFQNPIEESIYNTNTTVASTNFGDANSQFRNINQQLNSQKTQELSGKQVGGMAASGALKGASIGTQILPGWGTAIGAVVGGAAGLTKGLSANNKISDANLAIQQKGIQANNYMNRAMGDIKTQNANRAKQDIYNTGFYHTGANGGYLFANGGLMNPYGINEFNTGGTHEQNKYGGVPVSIAEDGKPNLVEEGEVLYDDYVYSNRIKINDTIRRRLKLKDSTKTFADAAKEVKERGDDRPNDPVTEHTIKAHMQILKSEQEKKKEQQEAREQQKMMAQINEQQLQAMQEQQMNEEADAYEQQMAQQQMAQQQQMQMPEEQMFAQDVPQEGQQQFAKGGNLQGGSNDADAHRFVKGTRIKEGKEADIKSNRLKLLMDFFDQIDDNDELTDEQKQQEIDKFINSINSTQDSHKAISAGKDINNVAFDQAVKDFQSGFRYNNDLFSDDMFESLGNVGENGNHDRFSSWTPDGYYSAITKERNIGVGDNYFTEDELKQINDRFGKYGYTWGNTDNADDNDKYYRFTKKQDQPETPPEEPKGYRGGEEVNPNYTWKYRQNYIPLGIDAALAAQSFAPADYSRANSIINTPIRDIQYKPIGGKIAPYIIDPRLQYQMNADLGAATNRGLINNAGGNSAAAQAALLANNRQISQSAANLGYQADAQNAAQIQAARQFNSQIDQTNSQGFLEAARANQAADVQRGEFNYYGQNMKENIDAKRGEAISNSMQSLADDSMKLSKDRYNQGMMAGLVDSGYFGKATPFLMQQAGWNPNGTYTTKNYLLDDYGNRHYIINNADGTVEFENPNNDLIKENVGKKLMFDNGKYYFG